MNTNNYFLDIEKLLGSNAKIKLIKILYKYKNIEQSISWLAKETKISVNQTKLIIDLYKELGIINYRVLGNSILVNLKNGTIYYDLIEKIILEQKSIKERFKKELKKQIKKLNCEVWIYGSFARGKLEKNSDVDILFLFNSLEVLNNSKNLLAEVQETLSFRYQKPISFLVLTKSQYNRDYKELKKNILSEGEKIYGQS